MIRTCGTCGHWSLHYNSARGNLCENRAVIGTRGALYTRADDGCDGWQSVAEVAASLHGRSIELEATPVHPDAEPKP